MPLAQLSASCIADAASSTLPCLASSVEISASALHLYTSLPMDLAKEKNCCMVDAASSAMPCLDCSIEISASARLFSLASIIQPAHSNKTSNCMLLYGPFADIQSFSQSSVRLYNSL